MTTSLFAWGSRLDIIDILILNLQAQRYVQSAKELVYKSKVAICLHATKQRILFSLLNNKLKYFPLFKESSI